MKSKRLGGLIVRSVYYFVMLLVFTLGLFLLWQFVFESFDLYYVNIITLSITMLLVPIYGIFYKNRLVQKLAKVIFVLILFVLVLSTDSVMMDIFYLLPISLLVLTLAHLYRVEIKSWPVSFKKDFAYLSRKVSETSSREVKSFIFKIIPLAVLYLLAIINFLGSSNYEALVVSLAALPLVIYIFNNDSVLKKYLQYLLYLMIIGIIFYWTRDSYGWIGSLFSGYFSFSGFSCFFTGCYSETGWNVFTQSALFTVDLKILFYIGIIFLALKNKSKLMAKF